MSLLQLLVTSHISYLEEQLVNSLVCFPVAVAACIWHLYKTLQLFYQNLSIEFMIFHSYFFLVQNERKEQRNTVRSSQEENKTSLWQEKSCLSKSLPINQWNGEFGKFSNFALQATGLPYCVWSLKKDLRLFSKLSYSYSLLYIG